MQRRGRSGDAGQAGSGSRQRDTKSGPRSRTRAPSRGDTDRFDVATDTLLEDLPAPRESRPAATEPEVPAIADLDGDEAPAREPELAPQSSEHKLLEVLASLDLTDLPDNPRPIDETAERAFAALSRGDWLRIEGRDGAPLHVKVAWINARRTVVLMVRHPDRRALSMRAAELVDRLRSGRARRVH
jgi:hypothetical protein